MPAEGDFKLSSRKYDLPFSGIMLQLLVWIITEFSTASY